MDENKQKVSDITTDELFELISLSVFNGLKMYGEYMEEEVDEESMNHLNQKEKDFLNQKHEDFLVAKPLDAPNANFWLMNNFRKYPELKLEFVRMISTNSEDLSLKYDENEGRIVISAIKWNI